LVQADLQAPDLLDIQTRCLKIFVFFIHNSNFAQTYKLENMNFPDWDRELFVFLNSKNVPWLDGVMVFLSSHLTWIVICLVVFLIMFFKDRAKGRLAALFLVLGVGSALIINNLVKLIIMRPRPGNEDLIKDFINQLEAAGASYSFFSAHSSSSFCLATFSALYFRNKLYGFAIFAWAIAVAYSRIYVGKHYPLDILVGTLFGILIGWLTYWAYKKKITKA